MKFTRIPLNGSTEISMDNYTFAVPRKGYSDRVFSLTDMLTFFSPWHMPKDIRVKSRKYIDSVALSNTYRNALVTAHKYELIL